MTTKGIRSFVKKAGKLVGLDKLFWYVYNQLRESANTPESANPISDEVFDVFYDSNGNGIELYRGLRDRVVPHWRWLLEAPKAPDPMSRDSSIALLGTWRERLAKVSSFLSVFSLDLREKHVLEVGTYDGATAFALAQGGANKVIATDMSAYYINQTQNGRISPTAISAKTAELTRLRDPHRESISPSIANRVTFLEDDICESQVPSESVDAVVSWEVLEHVTEPEKLFQQIARILKPGGFTFHEYNPFFSWTGGHSACTLDFPWGHARLSSADFERYLTKFRPLEMPVACSFYQGNLNRMSLSDLEQHIANAGLKLLALIPWSSSEDLGRVKFDALESCKSLYPSTTILDLISPTVWVLCLKASRGSNE